MRRTIVKTFSPDFADFDSSSSALRDGADELVALVLVEVADAQVPRLDERAEPADEPVAELALGRADRAAELVVELDGQVGDALGGQVGGDVDLAAAHDAEVDDGAAGLGVEAVVGRREAGLLEPGRAAPATACRPSIQPRNCQIARKSSTSLISGVPVSASSSGSPPGAARRMRSASASTLRERCDCRFLMKCASSTTMPRKPSVDSHAMCRSSTS